MAPTLPIRSVSATGSKCAASVSVIQSASSSNDTLLWCGGENLLLFSLVHTQVWLATLPSEVARTDHRNPDSRHVEPVTAIVRLAD